MSASSSRRSLLIGLGASTLGLATLAACKQTPLDMGRADRPAEGGVGGTGIVGTVIAQAKREGAALKVNGLAVETPDDLLITDAFGRRQLADLALGQTVTVEAQETPDGRLSARWLGLVQPLIGRIEARDEQGFTLLGSPVTLEAGAPLLDAAGRPFRPAVGQRVALSGLWRDRRRVIASRLDLLEDAAQDPDVMAGVVHAEAGALTLGSLNLVLPDGTEPPLPGSFVTALGRRDENRLLVGKLIPGRFRGLAGPLVRLSVEGYLEPTAAAPGYVVADLGHSFDKTAKLAPFAQDRALYTGAYEGDFAVRYALPLPENFDARNRLLASVTDGFAPKGAVSTR
ncbi:MAG: hypothetical protein Kilf2KO_43530 [Rhodospirillales bacterium]